jgi:hypothetical protein
MLPMDPETARRAMETYQQLCRAVLTRDDAIGMPGEKDGFVKRSGWSKLATFYGASTEILERDMAREEDGTPIRANALVRAIAPNGRHAEGDGACARTEPRFRSGSGRLKLEHDLMATAVTRATNRAISNLIGFGSVSAEEADPVGDEYLYGPPATNTENDTVLRALNALGVSPRAGEAVIQDAGGYLPKIAARAFVHAAANRIQGSEPKDTEAETSEPTSVPVQPDESDETGKPDAQS